MQNDVRREIFSLAIPVVFSSFLQRITAMVDVFLVGGLGAAAIAAVGLGQLMVLLAMTLVWGLSAGTTVVVAQLYGAQRRDDVAAVGFHAVVLGLFIGLGIGLAGLRFGRDGAAFIGAQAPVLTLLDPYLRVVFCFFVCTLLVNLLSAVLYGIGNTRPPLHAAVVMNVVHVAVAYPLIYGAWGAPRLGVLGAAVAVGASELTGALYLLAICFRKRYLRAGRIRADLLRHVWHVGLPVFGERLLQQSSQMMYAKVVMLYGTVAYAAHQVGLTIEAMSFLPGLGISMAATTAVGQRLGARQWLQAAIAHREARRLALMFMSAMAVLFFFAPTALLRLFTSDPEVIGLGTSFLKIVAVLQIPLAMTMVLSGSLRGAGDTLFLFWSTIVGSWGIRVPLAWLLATVFAADVTVIWSLMIVDWLARMGLLMYRYRTENWRTTQLLGDPTPELDPSLVPAKNG